VRIAEVFPAIGIATNIAHGAVPATLGVEGVAVECGIKFMQRLL